MVGALFLVVLTRPVSADPSKSYDAVVVLAGGNGERLNAGLELVDDAADAELIVSNGKSGIWYAGGRICDLDRSIAVTCPTPEPPDTRGEVGMVRRLVDANGWDDVAIVTSSYHRLRVARMVGQCELSGVDVVGMSPNISRVAWVDRLAHEVGGNLATTFVRGCV